MITKSDGELNALKTAVPAIGALKRDLQSKMNVLFHVSEVKHFTIPQTLEINDLIAGWSPQPVDIFKNYWPGGEDLIPNDASHYDLLGNWASLAFNSTQYPLFKVRDAIAMIESFELFQNSADILSPLRNKTPPCCDRPEANVLCILARIR